MHSARLIKFAFIFVALALTVFLLSQTNENVERVELTPVETDNPLGKNSVTDVATTMEAPRFSGQDNKNRKWLVTAKKAVQTGALGTEKVTLDTVQANATNSDGEELAFSAKEGLFDRTSQTLALQKGIHINGYGFTLDTMEMVASLKESAVHGNAPVKVVTEQGNLSANSFNIIENGKQVSFKGDVKTQLGKEAILRAQKLDIFLLGQNPSKTATGSIDKIIAEEKVIIQREKDVAKGDKATYNPSMGEIVLSGDVIFIRDKNVLKGDKLVYNLKTGQANLTSNETTGETGEPGRIKMQLIPN